jgi:hypothetical protein
MIYVKSVLFGTGAAIVAAILWILTVFVLPIVVPFALSGVTGTGGMSAASIGSGSILAAALVGFVAGFYWKFRRLSRRS